MLSLESINVNRDDPGMFWVFFNNHAAIATFIAPAFREMDDALIQEKISPLNARREGL